MKLISETVEDVNYLIEDDESGKRMIEFVVPFYKPRLKIEMVASIRWAF